MAVWWLEGDKFGGNMLFRKMIFEMKTPESYVKPHMNGFGDPTIRDYCPLSLTPAYKPMGRKEQAWEEYVFSYVDAAKVLAESRASNQSSPVLMVFHKHSSVIPCLFLCRQALELAIKDCISKAGKSYDRIHDINSLWKELVKVIDTDKSAEDREWTILTKMGEFVELISSLDNMGGTKLRYPVDKKGKESQTVLTFVSLNSIVTTTELFVNQLNELSFGSAQRKTDKQFFEKCGKVCTRVIEESLGANRTYMLLIQLRDFISEHREIAEAAPVFFNTIAANCMQVLLVELYKMFDDSKDNEGIKTFIKKVKEGMNQLNSSIEIRANFIKTLHDTSATVQPFASIKEAIRFSEDELAKNEDLLKRVGKLRNKYYAHTDARIKDFEELFRKYQLSFGDVEHLLTVNWNLCNIFNRYFNDVTTMPLIAGHDDSEHIFQMLIEKKEEAFSL